jgi:hypothetical protein
MVYNLRIIAFRDRHAKTVIARQLTQENGVSLQQALAMVEHLPLMLHSSSDLEEATARLRQYGKIGIEAQAVEALPLPKHESANTASPQVQRATPSAAPRGGAESPGIGGSFGKEHVQGKEPVTFGLGPVRKRRITTELWAVIILAAFIAFVVAAVSFSHRSVKRGSVVLAHVSGESATSALDSTAKAVASGERSTPHAATNTPASPSPATPPSTDSDQAQKYTDSGLVHAGDTGSAIRFYKMAIAFNRYNLHAWYGLLNAYQAAGRSEEARTTEKEMRRLFGENTFTIERLIQPLGTLTEYRVSADGVAQLRYRTATMPDRARLIAEAYALARALRTRCGCKEISIVATAGPATLSVGCSAVRPFGSLEEFESTARISFVDK